MISTTLKSILSPAANPKNDVFIEQGTIYSDQTRHDALTALTWCLGDVLVTDNDGEGLHYVTTMQARGLINLGLIDWIRFGDTIGDDAQARLVHEVSIATVKALCL